MAAGSRFEFTDDDRFSSRFDAGMDMLRGMLNDLRALRSPSKYDSAFPDSTTTTCGERSEFNLHQDKVPQVQADARVPIAKMVERTEPAPIHGKAYNILVVGACESEDKAYKVCIEMSKPNLAEDLKAYNILVVGACESEDKAYYVFDEMPSQTLIDSEKVIEVAGAKQMGEMAVDYGVCKGTDNLHQDREINSESPRMFHGSTEPISTDSQTFPEKFESFSAIEEVEFSSMAIGNQLMVKPAVICPSKLDVQEVAYHVLDKLTEPVPIQKSVHEMTNSARDGTQLPEQDEVQQQLEDKISNKMKMKENYGFILGRQAVQNEDPKVFVEMSGPFLKEEQLEGAAVTHYMFDEMPKPTPTGLLRTEDSFYVSLLGKEVHPLLYAFGTRLADEHEKSHISKLGIVELWIGEVPMFVFDPGGSLLLYNSCNPSNCFLNGKPDTAYDKLRWKPKSCSLPRLVFVGNYLNRNTWESLVCVPGNSVKDQKKVYEAPSNVQLTEAYCSLVFEDYEFTIEFFATPFLVQEWEIQATNGEKKEIATVLMVNLHNGMLNSKSGELSYCIKLVFGNSWGKYILEVVTVFVEMEKNEMSDSHLLPHLKPDIEFCISKVPMFVFDPGGICQSALKISVAAKVLAAYFTLSMINKAMRWWNEEADAPSWVTLINGETFEFGCNGLFTEKGGLCAKFFLFFSFSTSLGTRMFSRGREGGYAALVIKGIGDMICIDDEGRRLKLSKGIWKVIPKFLTSFVGNEQSSLGDFKQGDSTTELEHYIWDPGSFVSVSQLFWEDSVRGFHLTTLRTRWLLRGRICHESGLKLKKDNYLYFDR